MSTSIRIRALALVSAVLFAAACADPVSQPAPPSADLQVGEEGLKLGDLSLLSCSQLPYDSVTTIIGPAGGALNVGPHRLLVPAGSLAQPVAITATIVTGPTNRVHFEPEGLKFGAPASVTISYANCGLLGSLLPKHVAYVDVNLSILELLRTTDNLLARKVTGRIKHFSDYAVAW